MMFEPVDITLPQDDWLLAVAGDVGAKYRIQKMVDGLVLYQHNMAPEGGMVVISVNELVLSGMFPNLTVTLGFDDG